MPRRIAAALQESHGPSAAPSTIFSFVKVRARRRTLYALPASDDSPVFQSTPVNPKARDFFTPPEPKESHEAKRRPNAWKIRLGSSAPFISKAFLL
jgi:hypothetical protein